jgi:hypothetical protein
VPGGQHEAETKDGGNRQEDDDWKVFEKKFVHFELPRPPREGAESGLLRPNSVEVQTHVDKGFSLRTVRNDMRVLPQASALPFTSTVHKTQTPLVAPNSKAVYELFCSRAEHD